MSVFAAQRTFRSVATIRRLVPRCSRVTYYSMPARSGWSCATYKRFLHLASSQVFTKYTARGLEFSQKERLVCARGFVEIFPPAAFLIPPSVSHCFLRLFTPRTNEVERIVVSRRVRRNGLKEEARHGLYERYVGSYFVMPNSHTDTETDAAGQSCGITKDPFVPFIKTLLVDSDGFREQ